MPDFKHFESTLIPNDQAKDGITTRVTVIRNAFLLLESLRRYEIANESEEYLHGCQTW